ncbi:MAG TPA: flagellar hook-associated protein FlgL [Fimbriimonas sp.]|nr:flagellar hook-associated protein FlgL [Fimbriimonas sp.]
MRISTAYQYDVNFVNVNNAQQALFKAGQQEATGIQLSAPSDNPVAVQQVLNMQGLQDSLNQYQSNLGQANAVLSSTGSALQSVGSIMQSAYQLALQGTSGTIDDTTRQGLVSQVQDLEKQLITAGNAQGTNGQYLFAGQKTDTKPFSLDIDGSLKYSGDDNSIEVPAGPSDTITVNTAGQPLISDAFAALKSLENNLSSNDLQAVSDNDLANLKDSQSAISLAQGSVGSKAQKVMSLTSNNARRITDLTSQISNLKEVNLAQAATNYAQAQNAYQAALTVVSRVSSLSLMNFLTGN